MGAETFIVKSKGASAEAAFVDAVHKAQYEYGHGGYTGTIAEKGEFVMIDCPVGMDPHRYANMLIEDGDERIDDKWGPAGCIKIDEDTYLFFGSASS